MSHDLTGIATLSTITVPDDGDDAVATTGGSDTPIEDPFQALANHSAYIRDALRAVSAGRIGGYSTGGQITVEAHQRWLGSLLRTIGAGTLSLSGLTSNTWYYVYEYLSGSSVVREASTTAPDPATGYTTKTGDTAKLYCFPFYALSATSCRPFRTRGGRYVFLIGAGSSVLGDFEALTAGAATSWTPVDLSAFAPPHAAAWLLDAYFSPKTGGYQAWSLRPDGQTSEAYNALQRGTDALGQFVTPLEVAKHPSGGVGVDYEVIDVASVGTPPILSLFVRGFVE